MIRVLGLALYGSQAASTRQRLEQYVPGLKDGDIELHINHLLDDDYLDSRFNDHAPSLIKVLNSGWRRLAQLRQQSSFDLALVHCELFPLMPRWIESFLLSIPYVYDYDDAFYLKYQTGKLRVFRSLLNDKFDSIMENAAAVTAGNFTLRDYAKERNETVELLPTVVDTVHYRPYDRYNSEKFTVGWIGSPSTASYLSQLVSPLAALGRETAVRLVIIGGKAPAIPGVEIEEKPWSLETEVELINSFDVGVMPLPDDEWARGKCAFKLIQYMACAVPVIGSRVGANIDVIQPDCGFLAGSDQDWIDAFRFFRDQADCRLHMGRAARQRVEQHYSLHRNLPILASVIRRVVDAGK